MAKKWTVNINHIGVVDKSTAMEQKSKEFKSGWRHF